MMNSPASSSEQAFDLLHPAIQGWIWDQQWTSLRPAQIRAIEPIIEGKHDVIISAATASGKTEAAWLPIFSRLALDAEGQTQQPGTKALSISPLKALINDQAGRMEELCRYTNLPVYRRHGDVVGKDRHAVIDDPDGVLLITPESLESLFVNRGTQVPRILGGLRYVVIDELHSFIGTERGAQMQSLLHRVELAVRRRVPRIALSATLADLRIAADYLRPGDGSSVVLIDGSADHRTELQFQLRGYQQDDPTLGAIIRTEVENPPLAGQTIAEHIYRTLRGTDNLAFANSKRYVEFFADTLRRMCEQEQVPNEFFPHHGNLSRQFREDVEARLKNPDVPATAVCTSTLEMGIDIGSAEAIAQISPPGSVAALRQRLGRSGRRGSPSVLRMYIAEASLSANVDLSDELRLSLVEGLASIELLLEKWYEPPNVASLHLSTLTHQVLAIIAQHGGAQAAQLYSALCESGPFRQVTKSMFARLLRDLAASDILVQAGDDSLLPGAIGERVVNHYTFYTVFQTSVDYRLVTAGNTLGTLPTDSLLKGGDYLIFAGQRWKVEDVDTVSKVIDVLPAPGGKVPTFSGGTMQVADGIRQRMQEIYGREDTPTFLDRPAGQLLTEGRRAFHRLGLDRSSVIPDGERTQLVVWRGDQIITTIAAMLERTGITTEPKRVFLDCRDVDQVGLVNALRDLADTLPPSAVDLAQNVKVKQRDKYDEFLGDELLTASCAARDFDIPGAMSEIQSLARQGGLISGR